MKTFCLFIFVFLFTNWVVSAQNAQANQNFKNADSLFRLSQRLVKEKRIPQAINYLIQAQYFYGGTKDCGTRKECEHQIGVLYAQLGDFKNAEIWTKIALQTSQNQLDEERVARLQANLGIIYDKTGRYKESENCHRLALAYFEKTNNEARILITQKNLGLLYLNQSNYFQAQRAFNKALSLAKQLDNQPEIGKISYNIGYLNYKKGNYGKSFDFYRKALTILGEKIEDEDKAEIYNNLGVIYTQYDDTLAAKTHFFDALKIAIDIENKDLQARILNNIGNSFQDLQNYEMALMYYRQALDIHHFTGDLMTESITLSNMGWVYQRQKKYEDAKKFFKKSLEIKNSLGYLWGKSYQYLCFGRLFLETQDYPLAQKYIDSAAVVADSLQSIDLRLEVASTQAQWYLQNQDTLNAITFYEKSMTIIETMRNDISFENDRRGFMETVIPVYKTIVGLKLKQGKKNEAYSYLERMKTRNLLEILKGANLVFENRMTEDEIRSQTEIESQVRTINDEIKSYCSNDKSVTRTIHQLINDKRKASLDYERLQSELYFNHPDIAETMTALPIDFKEAANLLKPVKEAALVYMQDNKNVICFVLKRDLNLNLQIEAISIPIAASQLADLTSKIIQDWEVQKTDFFYTTLIQPVLKYLKGVETLCIVPDENLYAIPFQALQNPENQRFLIEDFAIYYDYSLSILKQLQSIPKYGTQNILAFGNPDFKHSQFLDKKFSALPKSEEEVKTIQRIFGSQTKLFLNDSASESNFKRNAQRYKIIHLATHGFFNNLNPMASAIVLTAQGDDDGMLSGSEIIQMKINADLVVLSACETAKGFIADGEGMVGLSRAFFGAKVPTIVASLWEVDDSSTKLLMEEFYRGIANNENYAVALQKAQIKLLKTAKYSNPFFWSPFILIGKSE